MTTLTERLSSALVALGAQSPAGYAIALDIELSTPRYLFQTYPTAWLSEYSAQGYVMKDATVAWGMQNTGWQRWSELAGGAPDPVFQAAAAHGMNFGVVFAFEADGHKSIASFARPDREFSVGEIEQLQRELRMVHDLLSDDEQPDLDEIKKIRAVSVALSQS